MITDITQTLSKCELLAQLTEEEIKSIAPLCQIETFHFGETVFRQGEQGTKVYIIKEGQIALERSVDLGGRKAQLNIAILGPGKALGCWLALLGETHCLMSSAICNRKTVVISLEGPVLRSVLEKNLAAGFKVMETLAYILRDRLRGGLRCHGKIVVMLHTLPTTSPPQKFYLEREEFINYI